MSPERRKMTSPSASTVETTITAAPGAVRSSNAGSGGDANHHLYTNTSATAEHHSESVEPRPNAGETVESRSGQQSSASTAAPSDQTESEKMVEPGSTRPQFEEQTQATPSALEVSRPPPLNYSLRTRKTSITVFWTLILIDSIAVPLVVYFCLQYLTNLSPNAVFSISTACLGGISIIEYFVRFWRLWKKGSTCRVIGARRWYFDWFHWNFSAAWVFIMVELIVGTAFEHPPIRLLAMPLSSLLFWFTLEIITEDVLRYFNKPAPMRISSIQKGEPIRPGIYSIIEDICAVDGSGGTTFRTALDERYKASHYFRQMLHRLSEVWAITMLICAVVTTILVFTLEPEVAYVVGWTLPFIWAGIVTLWTFWYVKRCLKYELEKWEERTP